MHLSFDGKRVVVVGGTSGINRGIAELFAAEGATVVVASRSQDKVDDTVASLKRLGIDVRDVEAVAAMFSAVHEALGQIDVLVSGAAGNFPALAADMSANAFRTVVDIDLMGTFHVMKSAYPYLRRPGCSIINISAPQAFLPYEAQAHVSAAKAGVDMITRSLSLEWGPEGLRINSVVPGWIENTEGFDRLMPAGDYRETARASIPLQRFGTTTDVANLCLFLASEHAQYISGQVISVDGAIYQRGSGASGEAMGKLARMNRDRGR